MPNPNPPSAARVKYKPGDTTPKSPWSQAPSAKIKVQPGSTQITWSIEVIPASAGTIIFNTSPVTPGIQFTGTGDSTWPGSPPVGDMNGWTSTITNTLQQGANAVDYPYKVNALFTPTGGNQVAVVYDPEVESDPPTLTPVPAE